MKLTTKSLGAALLLIAAGSTASAQTYWSYGDYGPRAKGYYGTPRRWAPIWQWRGRPVRLWARLQLCPPSAKPVVPRTLLRALHNKKSAPAVSRRAV